MIGHFQIKRLPLCREPVNAFARIGGAQKRPVAVAAQPLPQVGRRGLQVDDPAARLQHVAVDGREDSATAGGQHQAVTGAQFVQQLGLAAAKALFALQLENGRYADPQPLLQLTVRIDEGTTKPPGKPHPDGRLAGTHHAHEENGKGGFHAALSYQKAGLPSAGRFRDDPDQRWASVSVTMRGVRNTSSSVRSLVRVVLRNR